MDFAAVHPPCGTEVGDRLPEGYPVEEGVGLWCRECETSWWAQPVVEHVRQPVVVERAEVPHVDDRGGLQRAEPPEPAVAVASRRRRWIAPAVALVAFVLLAVVVATTATRPGRAQDQARTQRLVPTPSPAAVAVPTPRPAPTPRSLSRRVTNRRLTLTLPPGWTLTRHATGIAARGPQNTTVRISVGPRRGRSLRRLGADARRDLARRSRAPLRRVRVSGLPAVAVTAAGRRIVQVPDGRRRWLISRPADAGTRVAASLRVRPR